MPLSESHHTQSQAASYKRSERGFDLMRHTSKIVVA
jgi:hypothetical protein